MSGVFDCDDNLFLPSVRIKVGCAGVFGFFQISRIVKRIYSNEN